MSSHGRDEESLAESLIQRKDDKSEEDSISIEVLLSQDKIPWADIVKAALRESKKLWILSGPTISVSLLNFMMSAISQMFAGHLGELELAGAAIANVGIQGLAYGIMVSFSMLSSTVK